MSVYAVFFMLLAMMCRVSPSDEPLIRHGRLATANAIVLTSEAPLFADDPDLVKSAAVLVSLQLHESSLRHDAVGDGGKSKCAMQLYGGDDGLLTDTERCVRTGYRMLQKSFRLDPKHPFAWYARGPRWQGEEARRLSRDREVLAEKLAKGVR